MEIVRAKQAHCVGVADILTKQCVRYFFPKQNFDDLSQEEKVGLISTYVSRCYLPLVVLDRNDNNRIIAFIAINDYPHEPSFYNSWINCKDEWLTSFYEQHGAKTVIGDYQNSLFLLCFAVTLDYVDSGSDIIESACSYAFSVDELANQITLNTGLIGSPPFGITKIFSIIDSIPVDISQAELRQAGTTGIIWSLSKATLVRELSIRKAKVEDYDDLVGMVESQSEVLTSVYGSFFLANLIEAQDDEHRAISALDENGIAVGILCASTQVNLKLLQENFELENFDNLVKIPNDSIRSREEQNEDETTANEEQNEVETNEFDQDVEAKSNAEGEDILEEVTENETSKAIEGDEIIEEVQSPPVEVEEAEEKESKAEQPKDEDTKQTDMEKETAQENPTGDEQPEENSSQEVSNADDNAEEEEEEGEAVENIDKEKEDTSRTESSDKNKVSLQETAEVPDENLEPNAFALSMICLDDAFQSRAADLLRGAFKEFPDREYCILTMPFTTQEAVASPYFTLVPMKQGVSFNHVLYILHRDAICLLNRIERPVTPRSSSALDYSLAPVSVMDFENSLIQQVVDGMPDLDRRRVISTAWSHFSMIESGNQDYGLYMAKVGVTPIALVTMCKFGSDAKAVFDLHLDLDASDQFDSYRMVQAHELAVLSHIVVDPRFNSLARYIVRDCMSLLNVSHLMYGISHLERIPPMVLDLFHLVPSRKCLPEETVAPVEQSTSTTSTRLSSKQRLDTPRLDDSSDADDGSTHEGMMLGHVRPVHQNSPEEQFLDVSQAKMPGDVEASSELISARLRTQLRNTGGVVTEEDEEEEEPTTIHDFAEVTADSSAQETPRSQRLSLKAGSLEPYSAFSGAANQQGRADAKPVDLPETIRTVGNFILHKPQLLESKTTINARVLVVGASDSGLSAIETLLRATDVRFNMLTLLSPGGLPTQSNEAEVRNFATVGMANPFGYDWRRLANMAIGCSVSLVNGKLCEINRSERWVGLHDGSRLEYDYLVLATGTQDTTRLANAEAECSPNFHRVASWEAACKLNEAVETDYWAANARACIYGSSIEALASMNSLLSRGWDPKRIVYCLPDDFDLEMLRKEVSDAKEVENDDSSEPALEETPTVSESADSGSQGETEETSAETEQEAEKAVPEEPRSTLSSLPFLFDSSVVTHSVFYHLVSVGVEIIPGVELRDAVQDSESGRITTVKLVRSTTNTDDGQEKQEEIDVACQFLVCANTKDVDINFFEAVNDAGLVYDGGLVVDTDHCTVDQTIFGAGPFTKFARSFGMSFELRECNSQEVGEKVVYKLFERLGLEHPTADPYTSPSSIYKKFERPVTLSNSACVPGGNLLFYARMPGSMRVTSGRTLETRLKEGKYCRVQLDLLGRIESILSLGHEEEHETIFMEIIGKHSTLFDLEATVDSGEVIDLIDYLCNSDWALAIRHDKFSQLAKQVRSQVISSLSNSPAFSNICDNLLKATLEEHKNADHVRAIREEVMGRSGVDGVPKDILLQVERSIITFINHFDSELARGYTCTG